MIFLCGVSDLSDSFLWSPNTLPSSAHCPKVLSLDVDGVDQPTKKYGNHDQMDAKD
jgi:hypothetical protein